MKKRILIVEDDPRSLFALQAVLEQHGFAVVGTANAQDAATMDTTEMGAALIDLRLPHMPGGELARMLRKKNPALRLIFMTAYTPQNIDGDLEGAVMMVKPLELGKLLKELEVEKG